MDDTFRQLTFMEEPTVDKGVSVGQLLELSQGRDQGRAGEPAEPASPLLEIKGNTVDSTEITVAEKWDRETVEHVLVSCSCKSRFCPDCSERLGYALREKLKAIVSKWKAIQMWTITIDPKLFQDDCDVKAAEVCYRFLREKRAISEWVKALRKAGYLLDRHYFCVVEWQKNTEFPHFHILLQSRHIPHDQASHLWNRNFDPSMLDYMEPGEEKDELLQKRNFGFVYFTNRKVNQRPEYAANYATKYVIKYPEDGFPSWVLDFWGRIDRYSVSQGFWTVNRARDCQEEPKQPEEAPVCTSSSGECDCPKCRGDVRERANRRTIRERIHACAQKCSVMLKRRRWTDQGEELKPDYSFAFSVDMPYDYAAEDLENFEYSRETVLTASDYVFFRELMGIEDDSQQYEKFDPSLLWRRDGAHYGGPNYEFIIS